MARDTCSGARRTDTKMAMRLKQLAVTDNRQEHEYKKGHEEVCGCDPQGETLITGLCV